jgi:2-isopropylmalate synthase
VASGPSQLERNQLPRSQLTTDNGQLTCAPSKSTTPPSATAPKATSASSRDKLQITQPLDEIGVIRRGGYPASNTKDAEYSPAPNNQLKNAKVCAFGMTRRRGMKPADDPGLQALLAAKTPVVTIVGKTSDFHVTEVLRVSLQENLDMIADTVEFFVSHEREVFYDAEHFFDGWPTLSMPNHSGYEGRMPLVILDTTVAHPEKLPADPRRGKVLEAKVPVGIHTHNDGELAVANSLAAIDAGAVQVQGTINGIGERCGNADLISVMANLGLKKGYQVLGGRPLTHLTELSRFVYETANLNHRNNQPFVGQSAFAHKGGMHVHAIARATSSYEHMDPALVA